MMTNKEEIKVVFIPPPPTWVQDALVRASEEYRSIDGQEVTKVDGYRVLYWFLRYSKVFQEIVESMGGTINDD